MPDEEFLLICHLIINAGLTINTAKILLESMNLPEEEYNNNLQILHIICNERM
jgi:hypothetical protein